MKRLLLVATAVVLAACNSATATPTAAPAASSGNAGGSSVAATSAAPASPTPQPTLAGPWKIVSQRAADPSMAVNVAGFLDESHGITVGYSGEVHYTTDGGKTWPAAANKTLCRFGLDIVSAQAAWHCGNGGIGFSSDGGRTWTNVEGTYSTSAAYPCHFLSFLDATTGWAANDSDLVRVDNGGDTWTAIKLPAGFGGPIAAINLRTPTDGYVLGSAGTVWLTADGGKTWTSKPLGLTSGAIATSNKPLAVIRFSDATHGVVVARLAGTAFKLVALRTSDGGATWQTEQIGLVPAGGDVTSLYLAHDGVSLTVLDTFNTITLLRYQP
jgi:photosystem II stability/assembly factor-like uncharacterized protein